MAVHTIVRKSEFYDSLHLMKVSEEVSQLRQVKKAAVVMATDLNKDVLKDMALLTEEAARVGPNDLVIAFELEHDEDLANVAARVEDLLTVQREEPGLAPAPSTLDGALEVLPRANLTLISVPGEHAAKEAREALQRGLNVFLFSSNVPLQDEVSLKKLAREKNLLLMGPDCGTALIGGKILGFGNVVRRGSIGIVSAAGTGIQEVSSLIHQLGEGVSHAIGTGGRDLKDEVQGTTMRQGIKLLAEDSSTEVIVLISKPPSPAVARRVLEEAEKSGTTIIANFLGADPPAYKTEKATLTRTLEQTAVHAVAAVGGDTPEQVQQRLSTIDLESTVERELQGLADTQRHIRGLFSGGTLCYETLLILRDSIGHVYSNTPLEPEYRLEDSHISQGHTCVDMGSEEFVVGRAHPMIDPTLRQARIMREGRDPTVAVVLLDVVLGYGSHPDPAGALLGSIAEVRVEAAEQGRRISFLASVVGTDEDPQDLGAQERKLQDAGVLVL